MLPPDWLAGQLAGHGNQVVLHLTCKDANRNGLEGAAWRYASEGFSNILAITGDLPTTGFGGPAAGVFDLDSVSLIALLRSMNNGLAVPGRRGNIETLPKTNFFIGCVVSPFKRYERELMPQYFKLVRKLAAGARWVIPQLGYDMRKFHEIKLMLDSRGIQVPIVGNVYLLTKGVARLFNTGKLAGCVVSDELLNVAEKYSAGADKGKKFFYELAAKQLAVFKGLGFAAGYLGGITKPETFGQIIDLAESYGPDAWKDFIREIQFSQPDEFFLFEHDRMSGLSEPTQINPAYRRSLAAPPKSKEVTLSYRLSRLGARHGLQPRQGVFQPAAGIFRPLGQETGRAGAAGLRRRGGLEAAALWLRGMRRLQLARLRIPLPPPRLLEDGPQRALRRLGQGPLRIGRQGVFLGPRLRASEDLRASRSRCWIGPPVIYNTQLKNTSSWANFYLDRDHSAGREAAPAAGAGGKKEAIGWVERSEVPP